METMYLWPTLFEKNVFCFKLKCYWSSYQKRKKNSTDPTSWQYSFRNYPGFYTIFPRRYELMKPGLQKGSLSLLGKGGVKENVKIIVKFNHPWRIVVCTKVGKWNEWHLFWSFSFTEICKCLLNNKMNHNYWHSFANKKQKKQSKILSRDQINLPLVWGILAVYIFLIR